MQRLSVSSQHAFMLTLVLGLALSACGDPEEKTEEPTSMAGEPSVAGESSGEPAGAEAAGVETAGAETAGAETAGAETAGAETAGAETAGAETAGAETAGAETAGTDSNSMECGLEGVTPANDLVNSDGSNLNYSIVTAAETPYNIIQISSLADWGGPTTTGTYSLEGINYADCGLCLLASINCTDEGCEKTLYAEEGSVEISEIGFSIGDRFTGRLDGVVFREVTIDQDTFTSTLVEGGETWCLDGYEFSKEIVDPSAETCAQDNINCLGDSIPDYELLSCATGEMVSAHSLMDQFEKGLWMVLTASWCSACREFIPQVRMQEPALEMDGVNVIYVMGEDSNYEEPDLNECQQYAQTYGEGALDRFYIDFGGEFGSFNATFNSLWPYLGPMGEFGLPFNAMVRSGTYDYEYVYADGASPDLGINEGVQALTAP